MGNADHRDWGTDFKGIGPPRNTPNTRKEYRQRVLDGGTILFGRHAKIAARQETGPPKHRPLAFRVFGVFRGFKLLAVL